MLRCGIGKVNLEQANVIHNRGRDGCDDEQHGCSQQQERADVVEKAGNRHFDVSLFRLFRLWGSDAQRKLSSLLWSTGWKYELN